MKLYSVSVNEELLGDVMGHLTAIGAALQGEVTNEKGVVTFYAEIPHQEIVRFSGWLLEKTNQRGTIEPST